MLYTDQIIASHESHKENVKRPKSQCKALDERNENDAR